VYLLLSSLRYASKFLDIFTASMAECNTGIGLCQGLITEVKILINRRTYAVSSTLVPRLKRRLK
jgi:hypothetical protein